MEEFLVFILSIIALFFSLMAVGAMDSENKWSDRTFFLVVAVVAISLSVTIGSNL